MHETDRSANDPIAIIGIGCRLPGDVETPAAFWKLLLDRVDAISDVPQDRWSAEGLYHPDFRVAGRINVRQGGFVRDIDAFDADFFGISRVEALRVDPQQRMLLETTYRAIEDAGLRLEDLAGSRTGAFVGISSHDYGDIQLADHDRENLGQHTMQGGASSIAANRLSYVFDLMGPSFAVDTACSSSLIALHLACRSLRSGESTLAIVAGVNALLKPEPMMAFARGGFLSPDARCRAFDARANGYVRSEGAGAVLLKPLSAAQRDGDHVYAVVLGSAINEDGRTAGLAQPSKRAQISVLQDAYRDAGVVPNCVTYVEAHGTGTAVGDPIEAQAIGAVIGSGRAPGDVCHLGSVKTNLGHLEPASGMAGLIKLALSIEHSLVPPSLHFESPNPQIDFDALGLRVATEATPMTPVDGAIYAGINSFGFGGANAHAVLRSGTPSAPRTRGKGDEVSVFVLSARSRPALDALAQHYVEHLGQTDDSLRDLCFSAAARRSALEHRLSVVARSTSELSEHLSGFLRGAGDGPVQARRSGLGADLRVAFVYSGQGPQWWGMGRELLASEPIFRRTVERIDAILARLGWLGDRKSSLLEELSRDEATTRMNDTVIAQPAIFALQVGLTELWRSLGFTPAAVVGHSIGEVAASYAAGALSLEEATRVVFWRSGCQSVAQGKGRMLAVGLSEREALIEIRGYAGRIDLGAINGPAQITLSGEAAALQELAASLQARAIFHRFLRVDVPFHSFYLDGIESEFLRSIGTVAAKTASIPLYSTVTGALASGAELDAPYWYRNLRDTVRFFPAMQRLIRDGYNVFVEIAPHPILATGMIDALAAGRARGVVVPSLRRAEPEKARLLASVGELFAAGCAIDGRQIFGTDAAYVKLPGHPWQRERYWLESSASRRRRLAATRHPHLGSVIRGAESDGTLVCPITLDKRSALYIEDHRVQGPVIYPGAGHIDLAITAGQEMFGAAFSFLEGVEFRNALFLPDDGEPPEIAIEVAARDGRFTISTRPRGGDGAWSVRSAGRMNHLGDAFRSRPRSLPELATRILEPVDVARLYDDLIRGGLQLGPSFRGMTRVWRDGMEALAEVHVPESLRADVLRHSLHPAVLDACFQVVFAILGEGSKTRFGVYIPVRVERIKFHKQPSGTRLFSYIRATVFDAERNEGDLWIFDADGSLVAELQGFSCRYLEGSRGEAGESIDRCLFAYGWRRKARRAVASAEGFLAALPSPTTVDVAARSHRDRVVVEHAMRDYVEGFLPAADDLAVAYVVEALAQMNVAFAPGAEIAIEGLAVRLHVVPRQRRLLTRLFEILKARGLVEATATAYTVGQAVHPPTSTSLARAISGKFPEFAVDLAMLTRCGERLADVMTGRVDAMQVLFPAHDDGSSERFYTSAAAFAPYNALAAHTLGRLVAKLKSDRTLRVLEIGAGTGGMTQALLPVLPEDRTEYVFTDVSPAFLAGAAKRFAQFPFLERRTLDIERDPEAQGFELGSFDVIIASDVVHATPDVRRTLANIKALAAPGALLLLLELVEPPLFVDLIFGLTDGWWRFEDRALRGDHCTMPAATWARVLTEEGFEDVTEPTDARPGSPTRQALFLARTPPVSAHSASPELTADQAADASTWLLFVDERCRIGERVAARLTASGKCCVTVAHGSAFERKDASSFTVVPGHAEHLITIFAEIGKGRVEGVVHLWPLDATSAEETTSASLDRDQTLVLLSSLVLAQVLLQGEPSTLPHLHLITSGVEQIVPADATVNIAAASLWGFGRVLINEHPALRTILIDLSREVSDVEIESLHHELTSALTARRTEEIALRGHARYVHRLDRIDPADDVKSAERSMAASGTAYRAEVSASGTLLAATPQNGAPAEGATASDRLVFREIAPPALGPDDVLVAVVAASVNFRDVMLALGLLPPEATRGGIFDERIGLDFAGRVLAVGQSVTSYNIGDEVLGIAAGTLAGIVVAKAAFLWPKPRNLGFAEAAALPIAYGTAHRALEWAARMVAGDRVLIHAAAGGVGLAAVHLALAAGAEIFATAGTESKRELLRSLGVAHVYDSRTLTFRDAIMRDTADRGVDIVLNSLSGKTLTQSLRCLAPGGRFIEIGKRDLYDTSRVELRVFAENVTYQVVDVDRLLAQRPELAAGWYAAVLGRIADGVLPPLRIETFSMSRIAEALEHVARSRHVGKVVVTMDEPALRVAPPRELVVVEDATYLIVGGASGLGLSVAQWLVSRGARHLLLLSRNGVRSATDQAIVEVMRDAGATVVLARGDVADAVVVDTMIDSARRTMPPLRGVIHSAMVLDDAMLTSLDEARLKRVLSPKVAGAWNVHAATRNDALDFFVLFSSFSSVFGSPGQGNYAAANAFLDRFGAFRRTLGLPATVINWGVLGDVGFVARTAKVASILGTQGWKATPLPQTLAILEHLLLTGPMQRAVISASWAKVKELFPHAAASERFGHLFPESSATTEAKGPIGDPLLSAAERQKALEIDLRGAVARVLGLPADKVDAEMELGRMGLDSLMAHQLRTWIKGNLGLDFPLMRILQGPTVVELARQIGEGLAGATSEASEAPPTTTQDPWLLAAPARPHASVRLICFPCLGLGASAYDPWRELFPDDVELRLVQLPGREDRSDEAPVQVAEELLSRLEGAIVALDDRPFAFYGHSFGGVVAFALARRLRERGAATPIHVFVGAAPAPQVARQFAEAFELVDGAAGSDVAGAPPGLVPLLRSLGVGEAMLRDARWLAQRLPTFIADAALMRQLEASEPTPLDLPLTVFAGDRDAVCRADALLQPWRACATGELDLQSVPGEHLFFTEPDGARIVTDAIATTLARPRASHPDQR